MVQAMPPAKIKTPLEVGLRIEHRRRDLHLKQEAVAADAGMSKSTLSRIECGYQVPDRYQLAKLSAVLNCTAESLSGAAS